MASWRAISSGSILVVDADAAVRRAVADLLGARGHDVITAVNGREAVEMVAHARPGLVLLELALPVLDGRGFLRAMRARDAKVPVVLMGERAAGARPIDEPGVVGRIAKPIRADELLAIVERPRAA
jgi:CheY-like chemotaxis protein